jgi:myo-inositol-1(or 4)-monophosphatase
LAAGILLIREAGGFTADCDSEANPMQTGNIVAANADLLPIIKRELAAAKKITGA